MPFLEGSQYLRPLLVTNLPPKGKKYRIIPLLQDCLHVRKHIFVNRHCVSVLSCVRLFVTLWAVARQAPLSMGFPRLEYWSGLPYPSSGDLPNPGTEPTSLAWQEDSLPLGHWEANSFYTNFQSRT